MKYDGYGFYFDRAGLTATQGAISPAEQFFEGSRAEASLVRETGQNSIDACAGEGPVILEFELAQMRTADIPGISELREHLDVVAKETLGSQGHASMELARKTALQETIPVLRISDYGTSGLGGSESINDPKSPLSALTRGAGVSADDGQRGGSFGIGSAVGPMASNMNTVLYTTLTPLGSDVVFAGYSCLATHKFSDNVWRSGDGFFTELDSDDFHYFRNPSPLGPFEKRTTPGTDIYILGYRNAEEDAGLERIKIEAMRNFFLAIDRGQLIVTGKTEHDSWRLDASTLAGATKEDEESNAYYMAAKDPEPIIGHDPDLGEIRLYINIDDNLSRPLHTITVRRPLMRIDTFRHTSVQVKYAAVLECSDEAGNTFLRQLEPPQHHKWDPGRAEGGQRVIRTLKKFVLEGLKSRIKQQIGDQIEIKGLSKFLPDDLISNRDIHSHSRGTTLGQGVGSMIESSRIQGRENKTQTTEVRLGKSVKVQMRRDADGDGNEEIVRGKDRGGGGNRHSQGGYLPDSGSEGPGGGKISAGDVSFRSWSDAKTGEIIISLSASEDISGDLTLVALGPQGSAETDYLIPITDVYRVENNTRTPVAFKGNNLVNVELSAGSTTHYRLRLSSNNRYRLGIK